MELFSFYPGSCLWVASALNFTLSFSEKNRHTAKLTLCAGFWASFSRLLILVHDLPLKLTFLSLPRQNAQRSLYNMIKQMLVSIESSLGLGYLAPAPWLGVPLWWEEAAMFCTPKCNTQQTGRTTTLHLYLKPNKVTQNAVASEIWWGQERCPLEEKSHYTYLGWIWNCCSHSLFWTASSKTAMQHSSDPKKQWMPKEMNIQKCHGFWHLQHPGQYKHSYCAQLKPMNLGITHSQWESPTLSGNQLTGTIHWGIWSQPPQWGERTRNQPILAWQILSSLWA